jgi:SAM-dependent methyltransferase
MTQNLAWLNTLTGRNLLREEVRQVRRALDSIFGDQFIQIGGWGDAGLFRRLARTRRSAVITGSPMAGADAISAPDAMAVASDSVDAVLLPHTLELADDPHAVLREVDRILRPDGNLVVLGFNPWGWWGLRHAVSRQGFPPGAQRMISDGRVSDWLRLLEFKIHHSAFYYFVPPVIRGAAPRHGRLARGDDVSHQGGGGIAEHTSRVPAPSVTERVSGRLAPGLGMLRRLPAFAGCYLVVARKQTFTLTPIRLAWRRRTALVGGLVNPTTRTAA